MSLLLILDVHMDVDKIIFLSPPVTYGLILHPYHVSSQESGSFVSPSKDMSIYFLMQPDQTILKYPFRLALHVSLTIYNWANILIGHTCMNTHNSQTCKSNDHVYMYISSALISLVSKS